VFTKPLPSNDRGIHIQTRTLRYDNGCTENDTSNNSSVVACIHCHGNVFTEQSPSSDGGVHIQTQSTQQGDLICLLIFFFQNRESKLKISHEVRTLVCIRVWGLGTGTVHLFVLISLWMIIWVLKTDTATAEVTQCEMIVTTEWVRIWMVMLVPWFEGTTLALV
jgi:hypothetical protein